MQRGRRNGESFSSTHGDRSHVNGRAFRLLRWPSSLWGVPRVIRTTMTVRTMSDYQRLRLIGSINDIVSLVDGYNLPVSITNNVGCGVADCPVDLGPDCRHTVFPALC